ncbi:MAG: D-glycerate dehydrogenase [Chitinophagaceae bacterium]|jgi:lactate dehydrogenase-like 2-hydroxyacid dehydrogenase|nr:D-glycerate dehydrogenase [Chitinophagaceae bacterium]
MKVFITKKIPQIGLTLLEEAGCELVQYTAPENLLQEELIATSRRCDALLVGSPGAVKIDKHFLEQCSNLKVISLMAVGYDVVDVAEATRLKMPIGNTPEVLSLATADTAFLLMLAVSRKAFYQYKNILDGKWKTFEPTANLGFQLDNKTLGIFGLGKIGYEMAKRCKSAFNMKIIYHNRSANNQAEKELGATRVSFDELLNQSDVLSVHTALTPETKGIFNKNIFAKMKPASIFINTSRGAVHNETDLKEALEKGIIWGAGLDVTNPEPMQPDNSLLVMSNVCILPHIGSATVEARNGMARIAAENVIAGLQGKRLPHCVNPEIYC